MKIDIGMMSEDIAGSGALAAKLESQGFDAAWSFEGPHDPFFPLVLASQQTERIELGTAIAVAFARNPMICAHIAQDLQTLSKGRFILGLGTQVKPHIEKRFSQPWSQPAARMREFVLAIRAIWECWTEKTRLDFRGEFYTHTLMTPVFSPGENAYGNPRLYVAGVGPKMIEAIGEVADGLFIHPFHTVDFLEASSIPALEKGLATGGRKRDHCAISCQTIVCIGSNDEEIAAARNKAKGQISFYGSTPAYKGALEHHGYEALQPELNRMSKEGKWFEMMGKIDDELLDLITVSGTPEEVGRKLVARNGGFAERSTLMLYNETDPEAVVDVLRAAKEA